MEPQRARLVRRVVAITACSGHAWAMGVEGIVSKRDIQPLQKRSAAGPLGREPLLGNDLPIGGLIIRERPPAVAKVHHLFPVTTAESDPKATCSACISYFTLIARP